VAGYKGGEGASYFQPSLLMRKNACTKLQMFASCRDKALKVILVKYLYPLALQQLFSKMPIGHPVATMFAGYLTARL
jgi:hypothetical protein